MGPYQVLGELARGGMGAVLRAWDPQLGREVALKVILSGGDPLLMDDAPLGELIVAIESIPHVQRLRIHTRLPVVLPDRVGAGLVATLRASRLVPWTVRETWVGFP